jgi:hypothetical protein
MVVRPWCKSSGRRVVVLGFVVDLMVGVDCTNLNIESFNGLATFERYIGFSVWWWIDVGGGGVFV